MRSLAYVNIKYIVFASASEIGALILYSTKLTLRIQKNWKETPRFLEKYFIPTLIGELEELNPPSPSVKGGSNYDKIRQRIFGLDK